MVRRDQGTTGTITAFKQRQAPGALGNRGSDCRAITPQAGGGRLALEFPGRAEWKRLGLRWAPGRGRRGPGAGGSHAQDGDPGAGSGAKEVINPWESKRGSNQTCSGKHICSIPFQRCFFLSSFKSEVKTYGLWKTVSSQLSGVLIPISYRLDMECMPAPSTKPLSSPELLSSL